MNVGTCIHSNHSWKSFDSTFSQPLTWKLGQVEEIVWRVDKLHYGISTPPPPLHSSVSPFASSVLPRKQQGLKKRQSGHPKQSRFSCQASNFLSPGTDVRLLHPKFYCTHAFFPNLFLQQLGSSSTMSYQLTNQWVFLTLFFRIEQSPSGFTFNE